MKKYIVILMSIIILTGCSSQSTTSVEKEIVGQENQLIKEEQEEELEAKPKVKEVDLSESFKGINGCAVIYSPKQNSYEVYNKELCEEQISPYSTFKIITTLMGLSRGTIESTESVMGLSRGTIESTESVMGYDGTIYWRDAWNKEITLQEAFKESCVWYYEKIVDTLDKGYVQEILNELEYGNRDLMAWDEEGHHTFWISSSLKISPFEQVQVLHKIFEDTEIFRQSDTELLKQLMLVEKNNKYSLYGKTGSAKKRNAWFVGFWETEDRTYFAIRLDDEEQEVSGSIAKEIAKNIIETNNCESQLE